MDRFSRNWSSIVRAHVGFSKSREPVACDGVDRGVRRRLVTILAAVSLLLFVAVVALWAVSYRFPPNRAGGDVVNFTRTNPLWWVISARGRITLCRQDGRDWGEEFPGFDVAGFKYGGHRGPVGSLYNVAVPHWFMAAVFLPLPAIWSVGAIRHRRSARRRERGLCPQCAYDLRASADRCPECGASIVESAAVTMQGSSR